MASLRTISTRRLIAGIGGIVVLGVAGVGVGAALSGANPPAPQPLADALHQAATGAKPAGITADITFTNNLLSSAGLTQSDPLISGASGRLWMTSDGALRIELQTTGGGLDSQIVMDQHTISVYDGTQNVVYRITLPAGDASSGATSTGGIPSVAEIQSRLDALAAHLNISGAIPGAVGGVPSYSVKISPQHDGGLLGDVQLDWDAANGVPLGIGIYSTTDPSTPVIGLTVDDISFGAVDPSDVLISPPASARVVNLSVPAQSSSTATHSTAPAVTGLSAVQQHVPFTISAPATVDDLPLRGVRLVNWKGSDAALVTYGEGLGGIAVLERAATGASSSDATIAQLPSVTVGGVSGHELATPLGTVVTFTKGGVNFIVAGSVTQMAAEIAAGALS